MRFLGLALVAVTTLAACAGDDDSGGTPVADADAPPASDAPPFTILWAGDTLLADAAQPELDARGYDWPFARLQGALEADFTLVNLEGPITVEDRPFDPDQTWSYNAQPASADALATAGVDAASLANNHALDRGPEGLAATTAALDAASITGIGAGVTAEAEAPLLIETPHGTVGVVALGEDYGPDRTATLDRAGSLVANAESIERGRGLALAAGARWVVGFIHWGANYAGVDTEQRRTAALFAEAGYDLVVGHGAHVAQEIEIIDGMPVVFSLGNFVFGTPGRYTDDAPGVSLLLTTTVDGDGIRAAQIRCLLTDNDEVTFQPRLCEPERAASVLGELHPDVEIDGDVGHLRW